MEYFDGNKTDDFEDTYVEPAKADFIKNQLFKHFNPNRANDIDYLDNFALICADRVDFEAMMNVDLVKNNVGIMMNLLTNPLFPKDLMEKIYHENHEPAILSLIEEIINPPKLVHHISPEEEMMSHRADLELTE